MADGFSASVEATALVAMLDRVGPSVDFHCREVARDTAKRIVAEAQRRVRRATGETAEGIHWGQNYAGTGYVVVMGDWVGAKEKKHRVSLGLKSKTSTYYQEKHTGIWLEFGTTHSYKRPFLFASAEIEAEPHLRRLETTIQTVLDDLGR